MTSRPFAVPSMRDAASEQHANGDAEAAIVAALMAEPGAARLVRQLLAPADFAHAANRCAYEAVLELVDAGYPGATGSIDGVALADRLRVRGELDWIGASYIGELLDAAPDVRGVEASARIVRELADRRRSVALADRLRTTLADRAVPLHEALAEWASLFADRARDATATTSRALLTAEEVEQLPDPAYLVPDFVPLAGLAELHGPPGCGKSFFAFGMACDVAIGHPFLGRPVTRGRVVYVAAEGRAGLGARVRAWRAERAYHGPLDVRWKAEPVQLLKGASVARFIGEIQREHPEPSLIMFDTLARCMVGGDENKQEDMGVAVDALDRIRRATGAAVFVVHHTRKDGDSERGSNVLRGAVDAMVSIKKEGDRVRIYSEKQKDLPDFAPFDTVLKPVLSSCVLVQKSALDRSHPLPNDKHRKLLVALDRFRTDGGATANGWLDAAGVPKSSFHEWRSDLHAWGYVTTDRVGRGARYTLTPAGSLLIGPRSGIGPALVRQTEPGSVRPAPPSLEGRGPGPTGTDAA